MKQTTMSLKCWNNSTIKVLSNVWKTLTFLRSRTWSTQDNGKLLEQLKSGFEEQLTGANINKR